MTKMTKEERLSEILSDARCDCREGWCTHIGRIKELIAEAKAEERDWLVSNFEQHVMSRLGPFEAAVVRDILKDLIRKRGGGE